MAKRADPPKPKVKTHAERLDELLEEAMSNARGAHRSCPVAFGGCPHYQPLRATLGKIKALFEERGE